MTVSLCMIVKDEARFLAGCLSSVGSLADDIVIADTGSTDGTVEIAQAAGARVLRVAWTNDFAAARNAVLQHATGDFVLVLDADERLTDEGRERIRRAVEAGTADCWMVPIVNARHLTQSPREVLAQLAPP